MSTGFEDVVWLFRNKHRYINVNYSDNTLVYYIMRSNYSFYVLLRYKVDGENIISISAYKAQTPKHDPWALNELINLINCELTIGNFQLVENKLLPRVAFFIDDEVSVLKEIEEYSDKLESIFNFYYPCFQALVYGNMPPSLASEMTGNSYVKEKKDTYDILSEVRNFLEQN